MVLKDGFLVSLTYLIVKQEEESVSSIFIYSLCQKHMTWPISTLLLFNKKMKQRKGGATCVSDAL